MRGFPIISAASANSVLAKPGRQSTHVPMFLSARLRQYQYVGRNSGEMYHFSSRYGYDDVLAPHKIGKNCKQYTIEKGGTLTGRIISSEDFSFVEYNGESLKIDRISCCRSERKYSVKNYAIDAICATMEFFGGKGECIVNITNGSSYFFHRNQASMSLLNPKTWISFEHHLTNSIDDISYLGSTSLSHLSKGIIHSTNDFLVLPMLLGLCVIEEDTRTFLENSG